MAATTSKPRRGSATLELYEELSLIRVFETEAERQYKLARIGGYCHLSSGQEVVCVSAVDAMDDDDLLVTGYRSHGFALAKGLTPEAVMAELFGRRDGCAHGRGGSMHLLDVSRGFFGGWGIVAGQLPVATGLALALVRRGRAQAVLCELGDGAVNMGAFHESVNLAALWHLPIVYLIVNNVYGMGTSVERASAQPELFRRGEAYAMHGERVDGDDYDALLEATTRLMARARDERQPALLEAMTYRYRGHSVADAGLAYRTAQEIEEHRAHDAIARLRGALVAEHGEDAVGEVDRRVDERVAAAVEFAAASPEPSVGELAYGVHAAGSDEQFERMRPGSPFGELELVFEAGLGR